MKIKSPLTESLPSARHHGKYSVTLSLRLSKTPKSKPQFAYQEASFLMLKRIKWYSPTNIASVWSSQDPHQCLSISKTHAHASMPCGLSREMSISKMDHPLVHLDGATLGTCAVAHLHPDRKPIISLFYSDILNLGATLYHHQNYLGVSIKHTDS